MWPKIKSGIESTALALGGYTEAMRKADEQAAALNRTILTGFSNQATGLRLIAETRKKLTDLEAEAGKLEGRGAISRTFGQTFGFFGIKRDIQEVNDERQKTVDLLNDQLQQLTKLNQEENKRSSKSAADAAKAREVALKELADIAQQVIERAATPLEKVGQEYDKLLARVRDVYAKFPEAAQQAADLELFIQRKKREAIETELSKMADAITKQLAEANKLPDSIFLKPVLPRLDVARRPDNDRALELQKTMERLQVVNGLVEKSLYTF
jgi:hypothetical protein